MFQKILEKVNSLECPLSAISLVVFSNLLQADVSELILKSNLLEIALNILSNSHNPLMLQRASIFLGCASARPTLANNLIEMKAIEFIINELRQKGSSCYSRNLISILSSLCLKNEPAKDDIRNLGGIQTLINFLLTNDEEEILEVLRVLTNLSTKHFENKKCFRENGGIEVCLRLLKDFENKKNVISATFQCLTIVAVEDRKPRNFCSFFLSSFSADHIKIPSNFSLNTTLWT